MEYSFYYHTRIGKILISEDGAGITRLSIVSIQENEAGNYLVKNGEIFETLLLKETAKQLNEYLEGKRKRFDVKLDPKGTQFQKKVWKELQTIPYGETRSYKQIACAVGNEKASRAVGMANHNNPILCIIPCHRVIGANGTLVGFGAGIDIKEQLLIMEAENYEYK